MKRFGNTRGKQLDNGRGITARRRILILDADSKAGLAAVQSLGRAGHEVHAAVRRNGSTTESSRWCRAIYRSPVNRVSDQAPGWLIEIDRQFDFALIIPATESSLRWIRALPEDHPVRRKSVVASNEALDIALNKEQTRLLARELGIPVADSRLLRRGEAPPVASRYPVVLKPVRSYVPIGDQVVLMDVVIARTPLERHRALKSLIPYTDVQEQAWVPGHGVGVELVFDHGTLVRHFVHERIHELPLTGGASTLRRSAQNDPELVAHASRILERLNWHGAAMVEWRRSDDGCFHLMEINPRLWGSLPLTIAAGVDVPRELLEIASGRRAVSASRWTVGLTARNVSDDLGWCVANFRADHSDPMLLTRPRIPAMLGWLRILTGRERWDGWTFADPMVALHEIQDIFRLLASRLAGRHVRSAPKSIAASRAIHPESFPERRSGASRGDTSHTQYVTHNRDRNTAIAWHKTSTHSTLRP